ncbi:MAG: hypothetical protein K8R59_15020 [Thermoanaerobaculales bacterium]|nr:hypothetical protein [Thermoanaerobaculales bacterium]
MVPMIFRRVPWRWPIVAAICLIVVVPLGAQDGEPPEYAVQAPLAAKALLLDVTAVDGLLVAVGSRGHILLSEDQGQSWHQAEVPTRSGLNAVHFHDRNFGWAVGHDGVIVRTQDGGATWERVYWVPEDENPLMDVWFSSADEGFAIGAYGSFFETSDGGTTWSSRYISEDDFHLNQIVPAGGERLYIAAEAGLFYRSDDGGATWAELPTPYEGSFFGVLPLEGDSVLAFGLRGHLFRSDDAGETWTELETHTVSMLTNSFRLADGTIIITGLGGVVLKSTDGGQTFQFHQHCNRRGISAVTAATDEMLVFVGEFGVRTLPLSKLNDRKDG